MKTFEQDEIRQDENQNFEAVALHFPLMLLFPPRGKTTGIRFRELAAVEQLQFGDKSCQEIGLEWRREFEMKKIHLRWKQHLGKVGWGDLYIEMLYLSTLDEEIQLLEYSKLIYWWKNNCIFKKGKKSKLSFKFKTNINLSKVQFYLLKKALNNFETKVQNNNLKRKTIQF